MPLYQVGEKKYNIPDDRVKAFLNDFPNAQAINVQKEPTFIEAVSSAVKPTFTKNVPYSFNPVMDTGAQMGETALNAWNTLFTHAPVAAIPDTDEPFTSKLARKKELSEVFGVTEDAPPIKTPVGDVPAGLQSFILNMIGLDLVPAFKGIGMTRKAISGAGDDLAEGFMKGVKAFGEEVKPLQKLTEKQADDLVSKSFKIDKEKQAANIFRNKPDDEVIKAAESGDTEALKVAHDRSIKIEMDDVEQLGQSVLRKDEFIENVIQQEKDLVAEIRGGKLPDEETVDRLARKFSLDEAKAFDDEFKTGGAIVKQKQVIDFADNIDDIAKSALEGKTDPRVAKLLGESADFGRAGVSLQRNKRQVLDTVSDYLKKIEKENPEQYKAIKEAFEREFGEELEVGAKGIEKFVEWATMIKLTGLSTQIKNTIGNTVELLLRFPEKFGAGVSDAVVYGFKKATGQQAVRNVYTRELTSEAIGTAKAIREGFRKAYNILVHPTKYLDEATKYGEVTMGRGKIGRGGKVLRPLDVLIQQASGGRFGFNLGEIVRSPGRALGAMDVFFKELNSGAEIYALAARQALKDGKSGAELAIATQKYIDNPTKEMLKRAKNAALERTYQKDLGGLSKTLEQFRAKHPLSRLIVPFWKTPINLLKRGLERTILPAFYRPMWKRLSKAERMELVGRMTVGSATLTGLTMYALDGKISSGGKEKVNKDLLRLSGWQPYSIKIGDTWVSYRGFEPLSSWFRTAGDLAEANIEDGNYIEWGTTFGISYFKEFAENPFLMGTKDIIGAFDYPEAKVPRFIASMAVGSTVPVVMQQWNRVWDSTVRKPVRVKDQGAILNALGQITEEFKSRTPGLSKEVTPMRNIFGEPIVRESPILQMFGGTTSTVKDDKLRKELSRLAELGFNISKPSRQIVGQNMTEADYDRFLQLSGAMYKEIIKKYIYSPAYEKTPDEFKMKVLSEIKRDVNDMIRKKDFQKYYIEGE